MDTILFFHTSRREAWQKELAGVYRHSKTRGWRIQVVEPPDSGVTPPVARLVEFWHPVGCIAECSGTGGEKFSPRLFRGIPVVFLGSDPKMLPRSASYVAPSPTGAGALAARELLSGGIANFAFIAAAGADSFWSLDRKKDFAAALALNSHTCALFSSDASRKPATPQMRAESLAAFLKSLPKPCGILAENDYAAAETLDLAAKLHIRVPDDLAVVGVDNDNSLCENARPKLTSIALDFERAGYRAAEILDSLVRDSSAPPVRETYPVLGIVRRGSTPSGIGAPPRILNAIAFIREHACDGISVSDVIARMPGSRRTAEIDFRRATGRTILEEIVRVRFERVELMLRDRYRTLSAIAQLCGWRTENALRSAFRKHYGISMRQWRKNCH